MFESDRFPEEHVGNAGKLWDADLIRDADFKVCGRKARAGMKFLWMAVYVVLPLAQVAHGASLTDEKIVRQLVDGAMMQIANDNVKGGIETLAAYWFLSRTQLDAGISKTTEQRKSFQSRFGKPVGVQFIEQVEVAETVLRLVYLEKFENSAIRWQFYFYKPQGEWRFNYFVVDDNLGGLFLPARQ